ncbi:hypothetical protein [Metabacillus malikii]|uniref:Uncharacterized protein n=1 Tax=Metabacillus malikii TaxID=1504265 RepID=A0ABT9ZLL5_9BACI|nr:hypothetical protein [Metabacillus malikii]MDQ0232687.1 hypothetical protein [Metabacillus malikii]
MEIQIMQAENREQDWVNVKGEYEQFHIYGDNDDYVEDTLILMKKAATHCLQYPFYLHFEGYGDEIDYVLSRSDTYNISHQLSGRKVLTMSDGKTYHAPVPSYTVQIAYEETLHKAFSDWFYLAHENHMWLMTQHSPLIYENGFAVVDISQEQTILLADHDAQSLSLVTNHPEYKGKEALRAIFD